MLFRARELGLDDDAASPAARLGGATTTASTTDEDEGPPAPTIATKAPLGVQLADDLDSESATEVPSAAATAPPLLKRESLDEISAQAGPTLNTSSARHRIHLQRQRQQSKASGAHRQRAHTVATSSLRRPVSSSNNSHSGASAGTAATAEQTDSSTAAKAAKLAAAAQQSRHGQRFGGHSMAYLINQQVTLTSASSLKPTGATLGPLAPSVASAHTKRNVVLYRCKGRRRVATQRVPLAGAQLSAGDSYVLDAVDTIYVCLGVGSNRMEAAQARALAVAINDNEGGRRAKIETVSLEPGNGAEAAEVLERLQKAATEAAAAAAGEEDAQRSAPPVVVAAADDEEEVDTAFEKAYHAATVLYEIGDDNKPHIVSQGRNLRREHLATTGAFVLLSKGELFVWVGRKAPSDFATVARDFAADLQAGRAALPEGVVPPSWPTEELRQGVETTAFTAKFAHWELSADLSVAAQRSAPPLESQAFRARALTASGVLPARPAAFENVKPTPKPHERVAFALFSPEELRKAVENDSLPDGVEGDKLENHLSDADFEAEFGMSKAAFIGERRREGEREKPKEHGEGSVHLPIPPSFFKFACLTSAPPFVSQLYPTGSVTR